MRVKRLTRSLSRRILTGQLSSSKKTRSKSEEGNNQRVRSRAFNSHLERIISSDPEDDFHFGFVALNDHKEILGTFLLEEQDDVLIIHHIKAFTPYNRDVIGYRLFKATERELQQNKYGRAIQWFVPETTTIENINALKDLGFLGKGVVQTKRRYLMEHSQQPMVSEQLHQFRERISRETGINWRLTDEWGHSVSDHAFITDSDKINLTMEEHDDLENIRIGIGEFLKIPLNPENPQSDMGFSIPCSLLREHHLFEKLPRRITPSTTLPQNIL